MDGRRNLLWPVLGSLALALLLAGGCKSGETKKPPKPKGPKVPAAALTEVVDVAVKKVALPNKGYYQVYDKEAKGAISIKLVKIHAEGARAISSDAFVVCAEFTSDEGKTYDLDFTVLGKTRDEMAVSDVKVHKVDGVERYGWVKKGNLWARGAAGAGGTPPKKAPAEGSGKKEAPEKKEAGEGSGSK